LNCSKMNILSGKNKEFVEVNSMGIEYRKLSEKELDVFIEMRINQLREEGAKADIDLKPALLDYYMRHMKDGTFVSWIAVDGNRIIGTSGMSFVEKPPYFGCPSGKIGLLSSMFTNLDYRRMGIAKELLHRVVEEARNYGCGTIQITASDIGVNLYTAYGFVHNSNFMQYKL
jgi:GNAT superfamily N-acetyltransferase